MHVWYHVTEVRLSGDKTKILLAYEHINGSGLVGSLPMEYLFIQDWQTEERKRIKQCEEDTKRQAEAKREARIAEKKETIASLLKCFKK